MGIFDQYRVDHDAEKEGVKLNFGEFWLTVLRAGGSNNRYKQSLTRRTRPYQSAIQSGTIPYEVEQKIMAEAVAEAVVIGWGSNKFGEGQMPDPDDETSPLSFNEENVVKFLTAIDILVEVMQYASARESFQTVGDDVKN